MADGGGSAVLPSPEADQERKHAADMLAGAMPTTTAAAVGPDEARVAVEALTTSRNGMVRACVLSGGWHCGG